MSNILISDIFWDAELEPVGDGQSADLSPAAETTGQAGDVLQQGEHPGTWECRVGNWLQLCHTQLQLGSAALLGSSPAPSLCTSYLEKRERHSGCSQQQR